MQEHTYAPESVLNFMVMNWQQDLMGHSEPSGGGSPSAGSRCLGGAASFSVTPGFETNECRDLSPIGLLH